MKVLANDGISESGINKLEEYGFNVDLTTVAQELDEHLEAEGIIQQKSTEPEPEVKSGFRRIPKKE